MDLDANCSTLGANGALAEIVAKHTPEAYIGPAAHAVPPNLSQISGFLLFVVVQPKAKCLSVHFASKIIIKGGGQWHPKPCPVCTIILGVAGGKCAIERCKRIRGERYLCTHQMTLPYLTLP